MTQPMYEFEAFKTEPTHVQTDIGTKVSVEVYSCMASRVEIHGQIAHLFGVDGEPIGQLPIPHGFSAPSTLPVIFSKWDTE